MNDKPDILCPNSGASLGDPRPALPRRQAVCFNSIKELIRIKGEPPTFREIGEWMGVNVSTVAHFLDALEAKGYIKREAGRHRSISVIEFPLHKKA